MEIRPAWTSVLALLLGLLACSADGPTQPTGPDGPTDADVGAFVVLVNQHRASVGCEPLDWDQEVAAVAQAHSEDMVNRGFFDHVNPDGASAGDRLTEAGVGWSRWGENIAAGFGSAEAVLDAWLNSPGHRQNIETCAFTTHGVGLVSAHWTHVFTRP